MRMTVGEISKALGISNENIRYYVREGLIFPTKNEENNYWEYSSEDVLLISDIMFYRSLGISIKNIKKIFDGLPLEEIGDIIDDTKEELRQRINENNQQLAMLDLWQHDYNVELREIGRYRIGDMPPSYRAPEDLHDDEHIVEHLEKGIQIQKDDCIDVSLSFYCRIDQALLAGGSNAETGVTAGSMAGSTAGINDAGGGQPDSGGHMEMKKYISIEARRGKEFPAAVLEKVDNLCLITKTIFSEDVREMIDPIVEYARIHNFDLTGDIYGREQTNYYIDHRRHWICTLYAPIK